MSIRKAPNTAGKTIADQLAEHGMTWKSYQESLPPTGADGVNFSDGFFTDSSNIPAVLPNESKPNQALCRQAQSIRLLSKRAGSRDHRFQPQERYWFYGR